MEKVIILHNPGAGDEDHFRTELVNAVEEQGYECSYFSIKKDKNWTRSLDKADFAVVAGGDGTVRRVAKELVRRKVLDKKLPLAILPMGTANNLSRMLGIDPKMDQETLISLWKTSIRQSFDLGVMEQRKGDLDFFLEGAGYGVFPALMHRMDTLGPEIENNAEGTDEKLRLALEQLYQLILEAPADKYWLETDTETHRGQCLLLEVMNIRSIGPNIVLSPEASIEDGYLEVVCVEEEHRDAFAAYIKSLLKGAGKPDGEPNPAGWKTWRTKKATLHCKSEFMHLDDELLPASPQPVVMEARENIIEFLINKPFPL